MRALLLLALLAAPSAWAAKDKKETGGASTAAPTASSAAPSAKQLANQQKAREAAFATYEQELASGQKARAADALVALVDDPALQPFHAEAYGKLGDLLVGVDLPYSALNAYVKAFSAAGDADTAIVGVHVPKAMELATKVGDTAILEEPFSKNLGLALTEDVRGEMAYMAAREAFRGRSWGVTLAMLKMVKEGDPLYPDAKLLEGIVLNQQGRPNDALIPIEAAGKAGRDRDVRFKDMVTLNTARTYYGGANLARAIQYYAMVSRESEFWPQAQYERAWAHFRADDFNGALGTLMSLDTPFFADFYFPDADLLRIYSMFWMCKFPQADLANNAFRDRYKPVYKSMKAWSGKSPAENFELVRRFVATGDPDPLPKAILRPWATEDRMLSAIAAVDSADAELKRMKAVAANPFTERAYEWLEARRDALVEKEGSRVRDRIAAEQDELGTDLSNSEIFGLDILRMKAQLYEQAATIGKMPDAARTVGRRDRARKGWREWPFEGELWADELGYYRVDAVPECPASMRKDAPAK